MKLHVISKVVILIYVLLLLLVLRELKNLLIVQNGKVSGLLQSNLLDGKCLGTLYIRQSVV
jgi:hypothetical protein